MIVEALATAPIGVGRDPHASSRKPSSLIDTNGGENQRANARRAVKGVMFLEPSSAYRAGKLNTLLMGPAHPLEFPK